MVDILIRDFDEVLLEQLKENAAVHQRTPEEEARALLTAAMSHRRPSRPRENVADAAARLFDPEHGVDLDIPPRGSEAVADIVTRVSADEEDEFHLDIPVRGCLPKRPVPFSDDR